MKTIGVTVNIGKARATETLARLVVGARARGLALVACDEPTAERLPGAERGAPGKLGGRLDVLMSLGGDGSVLHAYRLLEGADVPLLGVNLGSLGFLTSVADDALDQALDALAADACEVSVRTAAACVLTREGRVLGRYRALNDVVIGWGETSRMVVLDLRVNGEEVGQYACDGLIVSTPTGSTGHSLSAGGPVVHPESPVFAINPICPHTLSHRPMIVPDGSRLDIAVVESSKRQLFVIDGQDHHNITQGDRVSIARAEPSVRFLHLPGYRYFSVLRQKLHWRGSSL